MAVSTTAVKIARGIVFVAEDARVRRLLPPGLVEANARLLREASLIKPWMERLYRAPWFRRFAFWTARHTTPGQMMLLPIRKRFVDDEVRHAIASGARQLLVVGAGLDTLAVRMAELFPDVGCFEIDQPDTQRVKQRSVEALALGRSNLHFLPVDLSATNLPDALARTPAWKDDVRSVAVAEGVLMYLDRSAVETFLDAFRSCSGESSTLVFTHVGADEHGELQLGSHRGLVRAVLKLVGEPLRWGIARGALPGFLESNGYTLEASPSPDGLVERYLVPAGIEDEIVGDIERLATAKLR